MAAQPALVPPSPTAPRHGDVRRIDRLREECGSERLVQVFTSLVSPGKPPTVRDIAAQLDVPRATAHRAMQSIPLRDISNMAHTQQREMLRRVVEQPAAALTTSFRPSNNQYLDNTEEEMLTKLIDDRARNEQAMGKSSIRQAAADIRSYRTGQVESLPGKTWYYDLVKRLQSGFKQVKPSAKEHKRAEAERADEIAAWFAILKEHIDKYKYAPGCIFALDETGLDGEAASRERVLVPKDMKRGSQMKGSLREHISMLHICNAAGHTLPPIFAFQGVWYNAALLEGAPVDSRVVMQASGYFEQQHMLGIMQHIFSYIDSNPEMYRRRGLFGRAGARLPTLLIFDGCDTHNVANAMEYAESRNMTVLRLLPNLTHLMQVADVSIFGPFKAYYSQECELWRRAHHGQLMSKYDIARVATPAWLKAASVKNVVSAFAEVGQYPFNPSAVLDKLSSAQPQMLNRRSLSDVSRMQLDLQRLVTENARLRAELAAATPGVAGSPATPAPATSSSSVSAPVLATYLTAQAGVHPSAQPKRKKNDDMLKDGIAGAVMTKPEIIARLHEAEQSKRQKEEKKAAVKAAAASALKKERERAAAGKKRKRAEQREAAGTKPRAARTKPKARRPADSQEAGGFMSYISRLVSRD